MRPEDMKVEGEEQYESELAQAPPNFQSVADMKMVMKAIKDRQRWKIPDHVIGGLPSAMGRIALGEEEDGCKPNMREQIAAARVLTTMEGQNQSDEQLATKAMLERIEQNGYQIEVVYDDRPRPKQKQIIDDDGEDESEDQDQPAETA